jgi:DNA-binding transcriptional ArsR family regulator
MSPIEQSRSRVEIQSWPGLTLSSALEMVLFVDELPGIGEDFERLSRGIRSELADSILLFLLTGMPAALTDLGLQERVTDLGPEPFLNWVETLNAEDLATSAHDGDHHKKATRHEAVRSVEAAQSESPVTWMHSTATETQLEQAQELLLNPNQLKAMASKTLRVFWDRHFRKVYASHDVAMRQVISELHPPMTHKDFPALLESLLGRSIQDAAEWADKQERILLVPFPFMGPYMLSMDTDIPEEMLILGFDAERAMSLRTAITTGPDIAKLKALADETRLSILRFVGRSERFGGEIVTHLGISQPGVSRHLRLLTASGLLSVRQEGTSKFYSSRDDELDAVADGIRQLKSDSKSTKKGGK